jgi:hypothetical protein
MLPIALLLLLLTESSSGPNTLRGTVHSPAHVCRQLLVSNSGVPLQWLSTGNCRGTTWWQHSAQQLRTHRVLPDRTGRYPRDHKRPQTPQPTSTQAVRIPPPVQGLRQTHAAHTILVHNSQPDCRQQTHSLSTYCFPATNNSTCSESEHKRLSRGAARQQLQHLPAHQLAAAARAVWAQAEWHSVCSVRMART